MRPVSTRLQRAAATLAFSAALAAVLGLSGCATDASGIAAATSEQLQSSVVTAAEQAAAGDPAGALGTLDSLQAQLTEGSASGAIPADRTASIQAAIDAVRADLQAAVQPVAPVEPEVPAEPEAPAEPSVAPEPTAPEPVTDDDGDDGDDDSGNDKGDKGDKGNNGNGNGNGNKGKGKND